jgi:hypothetical protein
MGMTPGGLINLFPVQFNIMLPLVNLRGVNNLNEALATVSRYWTDYIKQNEYMSVISGIGPISTIRNIGSALSNLVVLPIESFQREGDFTAGAK